MLFGGAAASFALPFLAANEERRVHATGIELMTGGAQFSGAYVHVAYTGDVELIAERGQLFAIVAVTLILVAALLSVGSHHRVEWLTLVVGGAALAALGMLWQATTLPFLSPARLYGYWLAVVFTIGGVLLTGLRLRNYYSQWNYW